MELRLRITALLVLLFNDPLPYERLTFICGRTHDYWRSRLSIDQKGNPRMTRECLQLLIPGLRAHIAGIRDHIMDAEAEIVRVTDALDVEGLFDKPVTRVTRR
jgi:hypothetical protein